MIADLLQLARFWLCNRDNLSSDTFDTKNDFECFLIQPDTPSQSLMSSIYFTDLECQNFDNFPPRVGEFCCAKFSVDGNWYRGLVLQVRCAGDSGEKAITVEVFYIDFGNIEQVDVGDLRELLPQFISMPAQVVRCSLADVNPSIKQELDNDVFENGES